MSKSPPIPAHATLNRCTLAAVRRVLALSKPRPGRRVPSPDALRAEVPLTPAARSSLCQSRAAIRRLIRGNDRRLLVVVGPCSVHDPVSALEYAERLQSLAARLSDVLVVCMRVYFDKPRTTVGWKGFINDPHLDGSGDVNTGLRIARALLSEIATMGLPTASELLDPLTAHYLEDALSWAAIGARTSESQPHRELASGLPFPVGLKNPVSGDLESAAQGLCAIQSAHTRLALNGRGQLVVTTTRGNPDSHLILRGSKGGPNYDARAVAEAEAQLRAHNLDARILVDASHGNSNKDARRQPRVVRDVAAQVAVGNRRLMGVMLESHLREGRQALPGEGVLEYGKSITDACLGFDETALLLDELAATLRTPAVQSPRGVVGNGGVQSAHRTTSVSHVGTHGSEVRPAVPG